MTQGEALNILQTGANVFLTGEPGSGKTHTVNAYIAWLRSHGIEPAITASTGIAATHIGGMTIHAWSGIGVSDRLTPDLIDSIASKEAVVRRVQKTQVLIIDEISMLSAHLLSMVDEVVRTIRHSDKPFGGMQVVLVGDFFQLPPVSRGETAFAFVADTWQCLNPIVCYLHEQHRQEDPEFLSLLLAIRTGTWDHTHVSDILARECERDGLEDGIPQLFTHNADVDRINAAELEKLRTQARTFVMQGVGSKVIVESLKRGCLSPEVLVLKEGAVVMATKNNTAAGYANGTLGVVTGFERGTGHPVIETYDGKEIVMAPAEWAVEENGKVKAKLMQVPLRLAWALTVHKSQGQSLDAAAMDLSRAFEYGQGYVALSRVRSLAGIYLLGWSEQALVVHPQVSAFDTQLKEASDAAVNAFGALEATGERELLEQNFIRAAGGTLEVVEESTAQPRSTYDETRELFEKGLSIQQIAKERALTVGTIADHAGKLVSSGQITSAVVRAALPARLRNALETIYEAFDEHGASKLTPVHAHLNKKYSFDELKLARVLYDSFDDGVQ